MTSAGDVVPYTACDLDIPGLQPWGPGWFLVAANGRVEAGPFVSEAAAVLAAHWMDAECRGVHPAPWRPRFSRTGLLIGSRARTRRGDPPLDP